METKNIHRIKCYQRFFKLTESGIKPFEIRRNDRDYQVGDLLELSVHIVIDTSNRLYAENCKPFLDPVGEIRRSKNADDLK